MGFCLLPPILFFVVSNFVTAGLDIFSQMDPQHLKIAIWVTESLLLLAATGMWYMSTSAYAEVSALHVTRDFYVRGPRSAMNPSFSFLRTHSRSRVFSGLCRGPAQDPCGSEGLDQGRPAERGQDGLPKSAAGTSRAMH